MDYSVSDVDDCKDMHLEKISLRRFMINRLKWRSLPVFARVGSDWDP